MTDDDLRPGLDASELRTIALLLMTVAAGLLLPTLFLVLTVGRLGPLTFVLLALGALVAMATAVCAVLAGQKASEARLRAELQYLLRRQPNGP